MDTATPTALTPGLDPEQAFLGCVMALPTAPARRLLAGIRADDFGTALAPLVAQLAIEVVASGHPPAPVAVYTHAAHTGRATTEAELHRLGDYLQRAYLGDAWPGLGEWLKAAVLEAAWRRALTAHAARLAQAAAESPPEVLAALADDTARADELHARYLAARTDRPDHLEVAA